MKKILIIIIAAVLVLAGGITFGAAYNQPENVAIRSLSDAVEELLARDDVSLFESILDGGAIDFDVKEIKKLAEEEEDYFGEDELIFGHDGDTLSGKLYISPEELFLKDFKLYNSTYSIWGDAYVSDELIYVKETNTFDARVGIEIDKLRTHFEDSIFAYDSGSKYSVKKLTDMTEEEYEKLLDLLKKDENLGDLASDASDLIDHIAKRAWDVIEANAEFKSEITSVSVGGHKKTARLIEMTVDLDSVKLIIEEFCTEVLAEDERIEKFISKHEGTLSRLDIYEDGEYDSFLEFYRSKVEDIRVNTVYEICDDIESADFDAIKLEMVTPTLSSDLMKLSVSFVHEDAFTDEVTEENILLADFGPDGIKNSRDIRICYEETDVRYIITENDGDAFIAKLYVDGEKQLEFKNDKENDKFSLFTLDEYGDEHKLSGTLFKDGSSYCISLEKYVITSFGYYGDEYIDTYDLNISLTVSTKNDMPEAPSDYITVDEIEESDIAAWKSALESMGIYG